MEYRIYTSTNWVRTCGDADAGAAADTVSVDGTSFVTGETAAPPGTILEVDGSFTISYGETPINLQVTGYYSGAAGHWINVLAVDVTTGLYENLGTIPSGSAITRYTFAMSPNHVNNTTVTIKFRHNTTGVNAAHFLALDKVQLDVMRPEPSSSRPPSR